MTTDNPAETPENGKESFSETSSTTPNTDAGGLQSFSEIPIADQIIAHLEICGICRRAIAKGPVTIGQKAAYCEVYWDLLWRNAQYEGMVNNIVAYTEHGDEAPKGRPLA